MRTSPTGLALIKEFEGFPANGCPYKDPVGVWTRGYGRTEGITANSPCITEPDAARELVLLLKGKYEPSVNRLDELYGLRLNQAQFDALVSFVYNLGVGSIWDAPNFQTIQHALHTGQLRLAADAMLLYDHAGGRVFAGLTRRRHAERDLFLSATSTLLSASTYNAPGQRHNDVWRKPKRAQTPLYFPNGSPTGASLDVADQHWPDHPGEIQFDYKEVVDWLGVDHVFSRGGYQPGFPPQEYGHVRRDDIEDLPRFGAPVPAGGGRGDPAPRSGEIVKMTIQAMPQDGFNYKASDSSPWANYGDAGLKYGRPGAYDYLLWSSPRTETRLRLSERVGDPDPERNAGGGMVRCLVPNGSHLELCNVERLHCAALDASGIRVGKVVLAYVFKWHRYGWKIVAHQVGDGPLVHHIV